MYYLVESWRHQNHTAGYHKYLYALLDMQINNPTAKFFTYPYFEADIETLQEQNYFGINLLDNPNDKWWGGD